MQDPIILPVPQPPEPEPQVQPAPDATVPNDVPATIHLQNGKQFIVDKVDAWAYTEMGVFATGHFKGYSGEQDILVPYNRVDYYELDFPRLKKYREEQFAKLKLQEEADEDATGQPDTDSPDA